jgi:hypothetical protein
MRRIALGVVLAAFALASVEPALADRDPYPHDFKQNNMGYCAPYLAQQRLPNGDPVRPFVNHIIQDATAGDASFEGSKNLGDFYNDKAQSETDQQCLAR